MYEFEDCSFSDPQALAAVPPLPTASLVELDRIRGQFATPADINDSPDMAPSRRIARLYPRYSETEDGPLAAPEMSLECIRSACPLFDARVARLEAPGE